MWRLTERMVRSTLVTACRLATSPTSTSPDLAKATTDGVVRAPSAFAMTVGSPPSRTATTEFVVPRSMPTARAMSVYLRVGVRLVSDQVPWARLQGRDACWCCCSYCVKQVESVQLKFVQWFQRRGRRTCSRPLNQFMVSSQRVRPGVTVGRRRCRLALWRGAPGTAASGGSPHPRRPAPVPAGLTDDLPLPAPSATVRAPAPAPRSTRRTSGSTRRCRPSGTSRGGSARAPGPRRRSCGPPTGSSAGSTPSAGTVRRQQFRAPAGVSWGVPGAGRPVGQPGGHARRPPPGAAVAARRRPPRHGAAGARRRGQRLRHRRAARGRGGPRRRPHAGCRSCWSPSGPRSRVDRATTTTTTAPAPSSTGSPRRSDARCAGWSSLDRVGVGRGGPGQQRRGTGPDAGRAAGRRRDGPGSRPRPMTERPGQRPLVLRAGRAARACASAARRTPATTRPATSPRSSSGTSCARTARHGGGLASSHR